MVDQYKIKSNEKLFDKWMKVVASPHTKLGLYGASMVQNDMAVPSSELNEWYKVTGELIDETEKHFAQVIEELEGLRQQTVKYIKQTNK